MEPRLPVSSNQCITGLHRYTELSNAVKITKEKRKGTTFGHSDGPITKPYFHVSIDPSNCSSIQTSSSCYPGPGCCANRLRGIFRTSPSRSTHSGHNKSSRRAASGIIQQSIQPVVRWPPGLLPAGRASAISSSRHPNQMPKPSQLAISKGKKQQLNFEHPAKSQIPDFMSEADPTHLMEKTRLGALVSMKSR